MKLLELLFVTALGFVALAWKGFVLSKLWLWFIASTFALPSISIMQAVGLNLVVGALTFNIKTHKEAGEPYDKYFPVVVGFVAPAMFLLVGWIVTKLG